MVVGISLDGGGKRSRGDGSPGVTPGLPVTIPRLTYQPDGSKMVQKGKQVEKRRCTDKSSRETQS